MFVESLENRIDTEVEQRACVLSTGRFKPCQNLLGIIQTSGGHSHKERRNIPLLGKPFEFGHALKCWSPVPQGAMDASETRDSGRVVS